MMILKTTVYRNYTGNIMAVNYQCYPFRFYLTELCDLLSKQIYTFYLVY